MEVYGVYETKRWDLLCGAVVASIKRQMSMGERKHGCMYPPTNHVTVVELPQASMLLRVSFLAQELHQARRIIHGGR